MRLFIAIDLEEGKDYFKELQDKIDKNLAKMNLTNSYHLTLKFLGEISEDKIKKIKEKLKKISFEPFDITFDKIGFFPSENYIRVIWIGVKDNNKVIELQKNIDESLVNMFPKDKRFHPHLTLARVKFVEDKENFVKNLKRINVEERIVNVKNFKLIKSTLTGKGAVYETLEEVPQSL